MKAIRRKERGAVSLFIVIFAALLIITIATAFIRIMLQDQQQASANDLSKSALDSAYAGVEDAKRAIVEYYQRDCPHNLGDSRCITLDKALVSADVTVDDGWTTKCDATIKSGVASDTNGEVVVKTNAEDSDLDQAYTCLKVQMNPKDYIGSLTPDTSRMIQLKSMNDLSFTKIKIEWFTKQLGQSLGLDRNIPYQLTDNWPANKPAVIRAQLLQYKQDTGFQISDFDSNTNDVFNSTLFLLPSEVGGNTSDFGLDSRQKSNSAAAQVVTCSLTATDSQYACSETITLPDVGTSARVAYLKLSQFYGTVNTDFRITMLDPSNTEVRFSGVQPAVDSTGRANDIFRRIRSRIDLGANVVPNPEAAVDVTKSLCKEFIVTNDAAYPGNNSVCPVPK